MTDGGRGSATHRVTVSPAGYGFEAEDGETVFHAARRSGLDWPTRCLGKASCRLCYVVVDDGSTSLSTPGRIEEDALRRLTVELRPGRVVRLACQARVLADVTVEKSGVHRAGRAVEQSGQRAESSQGEVGHARTSDGAART